MRALPFAPRTPATRRVASFAMAIAAHVLIAWLLLRLAPAPLTPPAQDTQPTSFTIAPAAEDSPRPVTRERTVNKAARTEANAARTSAPQTAAQAPSSAAEPPPMLVLAGGMELFDAADIGKMRGSAEGSGEAEGRGDSVAAYGPGQGPGGQRLYNAEWHREPSRAELAGYLPGGVPPGAWALIACRTIEDYHVDNCRSLGEAPAGSGIARAMRQAAWQFRVRPPRAGGKTLIGAWVRIRFDFDKDGASGTGAN
jgi:protein TonB